MARQKAFTLTEMLFCLAILGLLLILALPSYQTHIIATRRLDAKTALFSLASKLEEYYLAHQSYQGASLAKLNSPHLSQQEFYTLSLVDLSPHSFTLQASPKGPQLADTLCATLILTADGSKKITGSGSAQQCWR